jgi:hypothetical protein
LIYLKTFLAAVQNPHSVLYTENLLGKVKNAECYYGKLCSSYTRYALQCGIWYLVQSQKALSNQCDLDAWRGSNKAASSLFPDSEEDSATAKINRVLPLDRCDWVPYEKEQAVKLNPGAGRPGPKPPA